MKTKLLFPYPFRRIGWILLGIGLFLVLWMELIGDIGFLGNIPVFAVYNDIPLSHSNGFFNIITDDFQYELTSLLLITGAMFIGFSKLKTEDEFSLKLRFESLLWATYVMIAVFLFSLIFIYGFAFLSFAFCTLIIFLVIFNLRFYFVLYKAKISIRHEK
jgi:hypothetical protein